MTVALINLFAFHLFELNSSSSKALLQIIRTSRKNQITKVGMQQLLARKEKPGWLIIYISLM